MANGKGELIGKSLEEQYRIAQYYASSGLLPKEINSPEKALVAAQYCNSLGLSFPVAIRQICVINGKPSIYGDLPLAIVRSSGHLDSISEKILNKEMKEICVSNSNLLDDPYAAVCKIKKKTGEEIERFFTIKDAQRAGLLGSNCWKKYPKDMLKYRARTQALKDLFSDVLNGVAIAEYDLAVMPQAGITKSRPENNEITDYFLEVESE